MRFILYNEAHAVFFLVMLGNTLSRSHWLHNCTCSTIRIGCCLFSSSSSSSVVLSIAYSLGLCKAGVVVYSAGD